MGYIEKRFGNDNLWNMEAWIDPNPPTFAEIMVSKYGAKGFEASLIYDGMDIRLIITGTFSYEEPVVSGAQIQGSAETRTIYKNGVLSEHREFGKPISLLEVINASFETQLSWLSGDDLFVGSKTFDLSDKIQSLAGNDVFIGYASSESYDQFYGGDGIDTAVYQGQHSEYRIQNKPLNDQRNDNAVINGFEVWDNNRERDGTDLLHEVERLQFSDLNLALDTGKGEIAGSAYRIYKAAFDRAPDIGGLGFWINAMDDGASLTSVAAGFINSPEFKQLYGANVTDRDFVTKVYTNVLDRNPDQSGYDFWLGAMGRGATRADILASFSESPENIGNVADLIADGIQYEAWIA